MLIVMSVERQYLQWLGTNIGDRLVLNLTWITLYVSYSEQFISFSILHKIVRNIK